MLHGPACGAVDVRFSIPSICAEELEAGLVDIGLVPVAEIARQGFEIVPGVGIAARGAVRSILLFSRVPWKQIRTMAADHGSRTSVQLARVILRERFAAEPDIVPCAPDLEQMLEHADAALIIGDPALRLNPAESRYQCLDLAEEWYTLTRLPFVFAAWAGKPGLPLQHLSELTTGSYRFGMQCIDEIVRTEAPRRNISEELAGRYLRHHLWYELGRSELEGLEEFLKLAGLGMVGV